MTSPILRAAVLAVALALAVALGLWASRRDGRTRTVTAGERLSAADLGASLGTRATFVQFSTSVCAPCRATRRVLGDVTATLDGVAHVEVDAEDRIDLSRRLGVVRTPTVLVVDDTGRVVARSSGAMTAAQARAALAALAAHPQDVVVTHDATAGATAGTTGGPR